MVAENAYRRPDPQLRTAASCSPFGVVVPPRTIRSHPLLIRANPRFSCKTQLRARCEGLTAVRQVLFRQLLEEQLAGLGDLWRDDDGAVRILRIPREIVVVVFLGRPERIQRHDLGDDRIVPHLRGRERRDRLAGHSLLLRRFVEDRRAVLRALVAALPIERGGIVDREEHVEQVSVAHDLGVERDADNLGVSRRAAADLLVRGARAGSAGVPALHGPNTLELEVHGFETPEAPAGERGLFARGTHVAAPPNSWRNSPYPSLASLAFGMNRSDAELMQ